MYGFSVSQVFCYYGLLRLVMSSFEHAMRVSMVVARSSINNRSRDCGSG